MCVSSYVWDEGVPEQIHGDEKDGEDGWVWEAPVGDGNARVASVTSPHLRSSGGRSGGDCYKKGKKKT